MCAGTGTGTHAHITQAGRQASTHTRTHAHTHTDTYTGRDESTDTDTGTDTQGCHLHRRARARVCVCVRPHAISGSSTLECVNDSGTCIRAVKIIVRSQGSAQKIFFRHTEDPHKPFFPHSRVQTFFFPRRKTRTWDMVCLYVCISAASAPHAVLRSHVPMHNLFELGKWTYD